MLDWKRLFCLLHRPAHIIRRELHVRKAIVDRESAIQVLTRSDAMDSTYSEDLLRSLNRRKNNIGHFERLYHPHSLGAGYTRLLAHLTEMGLQLLLGVGRLGEKRGRDVYQRQLNSELVGIGGVQLTELLVFDPVS
jgi:hypothetical protein